MGKATRMKALSAIQRKDIKRRLSSNEKISALAQEYGVSVTTIRRLKTEDENIFNESSANITSSKATRKPQKNLDLKSKQEIIEKIKTGINIADLAQQYSVSTSTIHRINTQAESINTRINYLKEVNGNLTRKTIHGVEEDILDRALYSWFLQKRSMGEPLTGEILKVKAVALNEEINRQENFKASNGWLHAFKKRHGIHQLSMQGEKLSSDSLAADKFSAEFSNDIQDYDRNQVYNADETGLYWRSMPKKTLVGGSESRADGRKDSKDRVTVMCCANVTGSHKIPLLVIGKSNKPRSFRHNQDVKLPVTYMGQKNAWMDKRLFIEWYKNVFLPTVIQQHPNTRERPRKVLLLLDNAPSHPSLKDLNAIDPTCQVKYLPPNVTAVIQPMDQGVIEKMKKIYRKNLLKELLMQQDEVSIIQKIKKQTMKDCCYRIASSWDQITGDNIRNSWNRLIGTENLCERQYIQREDILQLLHLLHKMPEYSDVTYDDAREWAEEDFRETGWEVLDIKSIVQRIQQNDSSQGTSMEENIDYNITSDDNEASNDYEPHIPTIQKAYEGLISFRNWFETRFECTTQDLKTIQTFLDATVNIAH